MEKGKKKKNLDPESQPFVAWQPPRFPPFYDFHSPKNQMKREQVVENTRWMWIDVEYSGLEDSDPLLLEVGVVITDVHLKQLEIFEAVAHHSEDLLQKKMSVWCKNQFSMVRSDGTSLLEKVKKSCLSVEDIGKQLEAIIDRHAFRDEKGRRERISLCGSSVDFDHRVILKHYPFLEEKIHYRKIDVSTLLALSRAWYPHLYIPDKTRKSHRALNDILESLDLMRFFREKLFTPPMFHFPPSSNEFYHQKPTSPFFRNFRFPGNQ
jgi:oligoribonuclease